MEENVLTDHILLTALGVKTQHSVYSLHGATAAARLAPLALLQLLEVSDRPTHVIAVATRE